MKKRIYPIVPFLFIALLLVACNNGEKQEDDFQESAETNANVIFAEEFIMFSSEGNYKQATAYFDSTMKEELPAEELEQVWTTLQEDFGNFISMEYDRTETKDEYDIIYINGEFEDGNAVFQITLNQDEEIAGFYVL